MALFTKANGVRALLCLVGMWVLFSAFLSYIDNKTANYSTFSRLSIRHMHKFSKVVNTSSDALNDQIHSANETFISGNNPTLPDNEIQWNSSSINQKNISIESRQSTSDLLLGEKIPIKRQYSGSLNIKCKNPIYDENDGPITPNTTLESLDIVEADLSSLLKPGGNFQPHDCIPKDHVAIVIPFRDRYAHLAVFLRNIHPFLMKQHIAYRIFLIEQTNGKAFNRAALMNIGFLEALKMYPWDCFIFHDVDLLPLDNRNLYTCPRQPRHMSVSIDTLNFKLPYRSIFGGVSAMTREHFQLVNGFSNSYFGWGGEDDDMSNRLKHANLFISRYPVNIARYMMLKHPKEKANPKRYENLVNGISKMEMDGINSIKYDIYSIKEFPTFTWYLAELKIVDQTS
ncbi:PREDICTED: beta-1,4-N-acetylgalactosaminyltransferase bre-4 isoform X1 [Rhagoletis zephyria]|uniref:beta-1,4-N-acetylgalactosaminyltransferase bre-4-like n=2 Tax=Rhagoletis pomonella TaxID=28610 RepID=UPI0008114481|nr:PREDICTED: beta-1,4-N-acetylgalactosaminyltransferase bre-4 isoform X1 [Rhagoletis zephyria]XP_036344957.1 beta-1,4-N-acetylgalactosaminyltransferase bre-4-like [Rhagoletis pomonella]